MFFTQFASLLPRLRVAGELNSVQRSLILTAMRSYLQLIRPAQWVKNLFVFAALAFGNAFGATVNGHSAIKLAIIAFAAFCLASSAGYVFNDILDRNRDRLHPHKKDRPIASGAVTIPAALGVTVILLIVALALSRVFLPRTFMLTILAYLVLTAGYSIALKHRMILDVVVIAMLFVLRALGGAAAIQIQASPWLLICTFMLCLFLGFGKRRCEIAAIGDTEAIREHRPILVRYTPHLLTNLLSTSGGMAIITFLLYTLDTSRPTPFEAQKQGLVYTLPLVVYGIYRYAMLIELGKATGPTDLIIKDPPFLAAIFLWVLLAGCILYAPPGFWGALAG